MAEQKRKLTTDEKKQAKRLQQQRRRLKQRGATNDQLNEYFNVNWTKSFTDLSSKELKQTVKRIEKLPTVNVVDGKILPAKYVRNYNEWVSTMIAEEKPPMAKGFKSAMKKNLFNEYNSVSQVRKKRKSIDTNAKEYYLQGLLDLGFSKSSGVYKGVKKMTAKEFWKFTSAGQGLLNFDMIVYDNKVTDDTQDADKKRRRNLANRISGIYEQWLHQT